MSVLVAQQAPDFTAQTVMPDGSFRAEMPLVTGNHVFGLLIRNPEGVSRSANLAVGHCSELPSRGRLGHRSARLLVGRVAGEREHRQREQHCADRHGERDRRRDASPVLAVLVRR